VIYEAVERSVTSAKEKQGQQIYRVSIALHVSNTSLCTKGPWTSSNMKL